MVAQRSARRILVVDDEMMVLQVVGDMLTAAGYEVTTTHDPLKAVELIWKHHFAVIMTDLGMPVVNGWAVARQVKAKDTSTPVILFTGWGAQYEKADLSKVGVDLVLSKPLDWKTLTDAVEQATAYSARRQKEYRKHWRFPGMEGELIKLSCPPPDAPRFRILDISRVGLSFRHREARPLRAGSLLSVTLILARGVEIVSVPCKILYDLKLQEKSSLGGIVTARRCGIQFEELSRNQLSQLKAYLQTRALDEEQLRH